MVTICDGGIPCLIRLCDVVSQVIHKVAVPPKSPTKAQRGCAPSGVGECYLMINSLVELFCLLPRSPIQHAGFRSCEGFVVVYLALLVAARCSLGNQWVGGSFPNKTLHSFPIRHAGFGSGEGFMTMVSPVLLARTALSRDGIHKVAVPPKSPTRAQRASRRSTD